MKGGENMYWLTKLTKNRVLMGFVLSIVLGMMLLPVLPVSAVDPLNLGINYAENIGLPKQDVRTTIANIIRVAMSLLGIVALVIILVGGFKWMTAGGNEEKVGEAKKVMFAGVIGLAIIFSAYAVSNFVLTQLYKATTGDTYTEPVEPV